MFKLKIAFAALVLTWGGSAAAWDAQVCNNTDSKIKVNISVAAASGFSITVEPRTVSAPRSVAGLCINGVEAINESADEPYQISMSGSGWGQCSNANVFIDETENGDPYGHYIRTSAGITCKLASIPAIEGDE